MDCEKLRSQLDAYLDGELSEAEARALEDHAKACDCLLYTSFLYQSIPTKRLCVGALGILFIGSVGCFFAGSYPLLLCFRMFQAVGASMMIPIMMSTALLLSLIHI